jgi:chromosome segregation ATPase
VSQPRNLEERVSSLEQEIKVLRAEAAAARALAAGADRDVADYREEMRGQTRLIQALRESQVEQVTRLDQQITQLDQRTRAGFGVIAGMLEQLGATRPTDESGNAPYRMRWQVPCPRRDSNPHAPMGVITPKDLIRF